MDPNTIKLETTHRLFHYESQSRYIEELDREAAIEIAKCYLKLYLQQQEAILSLGGLTTDLEDANI